MAENTISKKYMMISNEPIRAIKFVLTFVKN
jgi:hypothetical protein